jgi:hypothetical protein
MIDLLRDPVWQFVGAVLAAIGIGIGIFVYYRQQRRKRLDYQIIANTPVLTVDEQIRGKLKVSYEDIPVQNVQLLLLKFINTGNVPIATADFERSLSITFGSEANVLSSEIVASSPSDLSPSVSVSTDGITLAPLLLNPNDYVTIKALVSGHQGAVSVTARIIGVGKVRRLNESFIKQIAPSFFVGVVSGVLAPLIFYAKSKGAIFYALGGVGIILPISLVAYIVFRPRKKDEIHPRQNRA